MAPMPRSATDFTFLLILMWRVVFGWFRVNFFFFFKIFCRTQVLFLGPLIPLLWTSGDVCPGFQSQGGFPRLHASSPVHNGFLRFTSGATPAFSTNSGVHCNKRVYGMAGQAPLSRLNYLVWDNHRWDRISIIFSFCERSYLTEILRSQATPKLGILQEIWPTDHSLTTFIILNR